MKTLILLLGITTLGYSQEEPFRIVSPLPQSNITNVVEVKNNWPLQVVLVKNQVWEVINPNTKYYVDFDGKIIDSFLYKDFINDTLKKNYMVKIGNSNVHYMNFGSMSLLFKAVDMLSSLEEESVSDQKKYKYYDMLGREMLEPKGLVIRSDGRRFVYEQ